MELFSVYYKVETVVNQKRGLT